MKHWVAPLGGMAGHPPPTSTNERTTQARRHLHELPTPFLARTEHRRDAGALQRGRGQRQHCALLTGRACARPDEKSRCGFHPGTALRSETPPSRRHPWSSPEVAAAAAAAVEKALPARAGADSAGVAKAAATRWSLSSSRSKQGTKTDSSTVPISLLWIGWYERSQCLASYIRGESEPHFLRPTTDQKPGWSYLHRGNPRRFSLNIPNKN